jgi:hypothetical protein
VTRYRGEEADYAVVIHPGAAAGRSVVEGFCASHAARGVDVWCVDPSPSGRPGFIDIDSPTVSITLGTHAAGVTGLPLFFLGFGAGAAVAYHALHASDVFWGAVLADDLSDADATSAGRREHQQDGLANFWVDRVLSGTTQHRPPVGGVMHNLAPMLCVITEHDPALADRKASAIISVTAGEAQIYRYPADMADLMASGFGGEFMHEWCLTQLGNHLNPRWV